MAEGTNQYSRCQTSYTEYRFPEAKGVKTGCSYQLTREEQVAEKDDSILVSAGTELIFFLVGGAVLCFGFRMRTMLITH